MQSVPVRNAPGCVPPDPGVVSRYTFFRGLVVSGDFFSAVGVNDCYTGFLHVVSDCNRLLYKGKINTVSFLDF